MAVPVPVDPRHGVRGRDYDLAERPDAGRPELLLVACGSTDDDRHHHGRQCGTNGRYRWRYGSDWRYSGTDCAANLHQS
ncbi:hypothetical protein D3C76_973000 [compost metagenome]